MKGLDWLVEVLGSIEQSLDWSWRHQSHSQHGNPVMFRDLHIPELCPEPEHAPIEEMADFCQDDYRTISGRALLDCQKKVGADYPLIRLAFDSYDADGRLGAAVALSTRFPGYPENYLLTTLLLWRVTGKIRQSLLLALAGVDAEKEAQWRGRIVSELNDMLDAALDKL